MYLFIYLYLIQSVDMSLSVWQLTSFQPPCSTQRLSDTADEVLQCTSKNAIHGQLCSFVYCSVHRRFHPVSTEVTHDLLCHLELIVSGLNELTI